MIYRFRNYIVFLFGISVVYYYSYETTYITKNIYVTTTYEKHLKEWENIPSCPALNESDWKLLKELTTPNVMVQSWERENLGIEDLGFVTYASFDHLTEAIVSCNTIRAHPELLKVPLTVYLSPDVTDDLIAIYNKSCPQAKFIKFPFEKFPEKVKDLNNYIFKPLYIAMAMRNHKVLLSFDSSIFFTPTANFTNLIQTAVKENPTDVSLLRTAYHSSYLTTHPKMYDCFPNIKPIDMTRVVQYNGGLVLWIGSEDGWAAMHRWVECALQPSCMAPLGATKTCDMKNLSPTKFSGCHRFDQAAINLILYEFSNFTTSLYQRNTNYFQIIRRRNMFVKPVSKGTTLKGIISNTTLNYNEVTMPINEQTTSKKIISTTTLRFATATSPSSFTNIPRQQKLYTKKGIITKTTKTTKVFLTSKRVIKNTSPDILGKTTTAALSSATYPSITPTNVIEFDLIEETTSKTNGSIISPDISTTDLPNTEKNFSPFFGKCFWRHFIWPILAIILPNVCQKILKMRKHWRLYI